MRVPPTKVVKKPVKRVVKPVVKKVAKAKSPTRKPSRARCAKVDPARVSRILDGLDALYPEATCELVHGNPFELLISTILSAQTTDKTVNGVTPGLFARYPDAASLAAADLADVEKRIVRTGFFRNKARNIVGAARVLAKEFDGVVPRTLEELITLPGVARKTANVVLGTAYGIPSGVVVDTHIARLSARLGLSHETDPVKIEEDLQKVIPVEKWIQFGHQLIWHGRRVCDAKKPRCAECRLAPDCPAAFVKA